MVVRSLSALALLTMCLVGATSVQGQEWIFDTETLFLQLHTTTGAPTNAATNFETGQRYSLSHINDRNIGTRLTYFEWDHVGAVGAVPLGFEVHNLDGELFQRLDLTDYTSFEMSGGVRYSDMAANAGAVLNNATGIGGVLGFRGATRPWENGEFYARGKYAMVMGEGAVPALPDSFNVVRSQVELAIGYEHQFYLDSGWVIAPRIGAEIQNYQGGSPIALIDPADIALGGFVIGLAISR